MVSKEEFVKIINRLRDYSDLQDKINGLFSKDINNAEMDFMNAGSICIGHETVVVKLLEDMFDDDIISWWIYECDYGRTFSIGDLEVKDKKIDLTSADKLYDYLVKEREEK